MALLVRARARLRALKAGLSRRASFPAGRSPRPPLVGSQWCGNRSHLSIGRKTHRVERHGRCQRLPTGCRAASASDQAGRRHCPTPPLGDAPCPRATPGNTAATAALAVRWAVPGRDQSEPSAPWSCLDFSVQRGTPAKAASPLDKLQPVSDRISTQAGRSTPTPEGCAAAARRRKPKFAADCTGPRSSWRLSS